mmetsp:Transcript_15708/g.33205  ORF Transcript_15708/g.33205 Transcript_15708/m.33205 type:complete len:110 (+) Transcript_15708:449-778(+)
MSPAMEINGTLVDAQGGVDKDAPIPAETVIGGVWIMTLVLMADMIGTTGMAENTILFLDTHQIGVIGMISPNFFRFRSGSSKEAPSEHDIDANEKKKNKRDYWNLFAFA